MSRLDVRLVELGLVPSRSKAQEMIRRGDVEIRLGEDWRVIADVAFEAAHLHREQVRFVSEELLKYVSRAGLKLEGALERLHLDVAGWTVLDVGQSTGGFTDCLLERGAWQVVGVDVGHGQLSPSLRGHAQVTALEKLNVRELRARAAEFPELQEPFALCVVDLSFISLTLVLAELAPFLRPQGKLLALVKPQFELGPEALDKNGIVEKIELLPTLEQRVKKHAEDAGFTVLDYFASHWKGQDGNQEYFLFAEKSIGS